MNRCQPCPVLRLLPSCAWSSKVQPVNRARRPVDTLQVTLGLPEVASKNRQVGMAQEPRQADNIRPSPKHGEGEGTSKGMGHGSRYPRCGGVSPQKGYKASIVQPTAIALDPEGGTRGERCPVAKVPNDLSECVPTHECRSRPLGLGFPQHHRAFAQVQVGHINIKKL